MWNLLSYLYLVTDSIPTACFRCNRVHLWVPRKYQIRRCNNVRKYIIHVHTSLCISACSTEVSLVVYLNALVWVCWLNCVNLLALIFASVDWILFFDFFIMFLWSVEFIDEEATLYFIFLLAEFCYVSNKDQFYQLFFGAYRILFVNVKGHNRMVLYA